MRVLGIDIASSSVKIAECEISGSNKSIIGLFELSYENSSVVDALKKFLQNHPHPIERISVGMGSVPIFTKTMDFPFGDNARVSQAVQSAFEDLLPFELDQYVIDQKRILKDGKLNKFICALVSTEATKKLDQYFEELQMIPNAYFSDTEALAQLALSQNIPNSPENEPYAVVDFGHKSLKISILKGQMDSKTQNPEILEMRTINRGTHELIDWIRETQKLSYQDSIKWLLHKAEIKNESTDSENQPSDNVSDEIKTGLRPLLVEVYQTFQAFRARTQQLPHTLHYTGVMTHIRGFREFLNKELRIQSFQWPIAIGFDTKDFTLGSFQERSFATALALAHYWSVKKPIGWLNFRRSANAQRKIISRFTESLKTPTLRPILLGTLSFFAFLSLYGFIYETYSNKKISQLKIELGAELRRMSPNIPPSVTRDGLDDFENIKSLIDRENKAKDARNKSAKPKQNSHAYVASLLDFSELPLQQGIKLSKLILNKTQVNAEIIFQGSTQSVDQLSKTISAHLTPRGYQNIKVSKKNNQDSTLEVSAKWRAQ